MTVFCGPIEHHIFDIGLLFGDAHFVDVGTNLNPEVIPKIFAGSAALFGDWRHFLISAGDVGACSIVSVWTGRVVSWHARLPDSV